MAFFFINLEFVLKENLCFKKKCVLGLLATRESAAQISGSTGEVLPKFLILRILSLYFENMYILQKLRSGPKFYVRYRALRPNLYKFFNIYNWP